jgi:hypothetical protein
MSSEIHPDNRHISVHAEWLIGQLPAHETYIETHSHRGTLLFQKPPSKNEVINDPNSDFVVLYDTLHTDRDELINRLAEVNPSSDTLQRWRKDIELGDRPEDPVERTLQFLYTTPGFPTCSSSKEDITKSLEYVTDRLKDVIIDNRTFRDIAEQYAYGSACYMINPPTDALHRESYVHPIANEYVCIPTYIAEWDHSSGTPYYIYVTTSPPLCLEPWPSPSHVGVKAVRNYGFEFTDQFKPTQDGATSSTEAGSQKTLTEI